HVFGMRFWHGPAVIQREGVHLHGVCRPMPLYTKSGRRSIRQAFGYALRLAPRLVRERFDVLDCQALSYPACLVAGSIGRVKRIPVVMSWHEVWTEYWLDYLGWLGHFGRLIELGCARLTRHHIAGSAEAARKLQSSFGIEPLALIPNGIDVESVDLIAAGTSPQDVLYVGRLIREKNLELLIEATSRLRDGGLRPSVLVVGDGPDRPRLEAAAAARGLDNIRFAGFLDRDEEVLALMKSSKVLALPSLREGFGIVVLEANACGVPVVTVDHPGNAARLLVQDGKTGLVTRADAGDLARALAVCLADEPRRRAMADEARQAGRSLAWKAISAELASVYAGLVGEARAA
ncbi:MAG: glycosyltransferase family 4 protein, partial [Acidimicrobiia bacterium]